MGIETYWKRGEKGLHYCVKKLGLVFDLYLLSNQKNVGEKVCIFELFSMCQHSDIFVTFVVFLLGKNNLRIFYLFQTSNVPLLLTMFI